MEEQLESLSNTLLAIYEKNLNFLKEHFVDIYQEVESLSNDLEQGLKEEKYTLEYIDGYFDILNHSNNGMYYFSNSYIDADERKEYIDFSTKGSLDLLRRSRDTNKLVTNELYKEVMPIIDYINNHVDLEKIEFEKIYKMVFIGTGLGLHIHEIEKKLTPYTTLIIEPELEIFRLSLFTMDYTIFNEGNRQLFLSVGNDEIERRSVINNFAHHHEYMNYSIKHYSFIKSHDYIKEELKDYFGANSPIGFPYKAIIVTMARTIKFLLEKERFLAFDLTQKYKVLKGKKVLLVSAGPSLDGYIDWIQEHQDKFIIVCVDVILKKLEKNNIKPDIVVSIDPLDKCAEFFKIEDNDFLKDSAIILHSQQTPKLMELIKDQRYYFSQALQIASELGYYGSTPNVGTFGFKMISFLGADEIYLIGNDAAFDQETGSRYAEGSSHTLEDIMEEEDDNSFITEEDVVETKGNLRALIKSNKGLLTFKADFEKEKYLLSELFSIKAYNMSDGAYMEGFIPITRKEMDRLVDQLPSENKNIINDLDRVSMVIDKLNYESSIKKFNAVIAKVKKYNKISFKSKHEFLDAKLELTAWILKENNTFKENIFASIFLKYIALSDIYVNFILNIKQKDLHSPVIINQISHIWADGIISVFKDIKKAVKATESMSLK